MNYLGKGDGILLNDVVHRSGVKLIRGEPFLEQQIRCEMFLEQWTNQRVNLIDWLIDWKEKKKRLTRKCVSNWATTDRGIPTPWTKKDFWSIFYGEKIAELKTNTPNEDRQSKKTMEGTRLVFCNDGQEEILLVGLDRNGGIGCHNAGDVKDLRIIRMNKLCHRTIHDMFISGEKLEMFFVPWKCTAALRWKSGGPSVWCFRNSSTEDRRRCWNSSTKNGASKFKRGRAATIKPMSRKFNGEQFHFQTTISINQSINPSKCTVIH